jgi:hypothetical protein
VRGNILRTPIASRHRAGARQRPRDAPGRTSGTVQLFPVKGVTTPAPTVTTPGTAAIAAKVRSKTSRRAIALGYRPGGSEIWTLRTLSAAKPGSTEISRAKLRSVSSAPITRTIASATSPATSTDAARRAPTPIVRRRVATCAPDDPFKPTAAMAPKSRAAASAAANEKSRTGTLIATSDNPGSAVARGTIVARSGANRQASRTPTALPHRASTRASAMTCCATRHRPAPSASRIAISWRRASDRASRRLPTFTHAINSTNPTAPSSRSNGRLVSPTVASRRLRAL